MKSVGILFFSFFMLITPTFGNEVPAVWGKIVKTKVQSEGSNYFIIYKREGKDYAYPIHFSKKPKNLDQLINQRVKVFGKTKFQKSVKREESYVMVFQASKIKALSLSDLKVERSFAPQDEVKHYLSLQKVTDKPKGNKNIQTHKPGFNSIPDKAANTAIFVGGAILAADILKNIISK